MIVDIEKVVATYLRESGFRARVTPPDAEHRSDSWVRLTLLSAPSDPQLPPDWFIAYLVQIDCYAGAEGGKPEVNELALSVRERLTELPGEPLLDAVVTAVKFTGMISTLDLDMEPARDRVILDTRIYAHPTTNGAS